MRSGYRILAAAVVVLGTTVLAESDETTYCNAYITSLPYTIAAQGHYCFDRNLSTAITSGDAIAVNTDFVVLDLNNFKLGGGSAGSATGTYGIHVNGHSNVTIRNGNIRGFYVGVFVGSGGQNNIVESVTADGNTWLGIYVASTNPGAIVRRNTVLATGGSTHAGVPFYSIGIWNEDYTGITNTNDNIVSGGNTTAGGSTIYGIIGNGWVLRNVVSTDSDPGAICFGNNTSTIYRDNNARGCPTKYTGGTNAGGNYP